LVIPLKAVARTTNETEPKMNTIIDLGSEMLIDRSQVHNPYLRLLLAALGQEIVRGSPWVAVNKEVATKFRLSIQADRKQLRSSAA
jgi:hypothetical protein